MNPTRLATLMFCMVCLSLSGGCNFSRKLDESSAKELIQEKLAGRTLNMPLSPYYRLLVRTRTDYSQSPVSDPAFSAFKKLMEAGFVDKTTEKVQYPLVSGLFSMTDVNGTDQYNLRMAPNSNEILGKFTNIGRWGTSPESDVTGTVERDGKIQLEIHPAPGLIITGASGSGNYSENGDRAYLRLKPLTFFANEPTIEYVGKATKQKFELVWYSYSWSRSFQSKFIGGPEGPSVALGEFQVNHVSDLKLVSETQASAQFTCTVKPNDVGALIPGSVRPATGTASFAKKPDGTWFADELRLE